MFQIVIFIISRIFLLFLIFSSLVITGPFNPENNQTIYTTHIRFQWGQIPNARYYNIIATNSDSSMWINVIDSTLAYIDKNTFNWNDSITWKVHAFDIFDSSIYESESYYFQIGSKKFPNTELIYSDESNMNGGLTIFGVWENWSSGAIDENGNEIWNDGELDAMVSHVDDYGQLFGAQEYDNDNVPIRGIQFDIGHNVIWEEPTNMRLDPHDLRRMSNGDILSLKSTSQMGPIPIGPWQEHYQNLGYLADGETDEINWVGQKIMIFDYISNQVLWEWNPFEHYNMEDVDLQYGTWWSVGWGYDWLHSNSIFFDYYDSSIYYSNRHISRIAKINYPNGNIDWMMGLPIEYMPSGNDHLCNDLLFSFQHDVKRLPNGNILFYDNGNMSPLLMGLEEPRSRVLEVSISEEGDCNLVWEYTLPDDLFAIGMGSVQILENGNVQITSGNQCGTILEVNRAMEIVWRSALGLSNCENALYRAFRVNSLYQNTFSLIINNYTYIDDEFNNKGVVLDISELLAFTTYNESSDTLDFLCSISEIINDNIESIYDSIYFSADPMASYHQTVSLDMLGTGVHLLELEIKTRPFYRSGNKYQFYVIVNDQLYNENINTHNKNSMLSNFPNPFNAETTLFYTLDRDAIVIINIYDLNGRLVKNIMSGYKGKGDIFIQWNGTNNMGKLIPSGVYLYYTQINGDIYDRGKMIFLK